jgi:hypothetical protein
MKAEQLKEIKKLIASQIRSTEQEITELIELTKPITLDNSIGKPGETNSGESTFI